MGNKRNCKKGMFFGGVMCSGRKCRNPQLSALLVFVAHVQVASDLLSVLSDGNMINNTLKSWFLRLWSVPKLEGTAFWWRLKGKKHSFAGVCGKGFLAPKALAVAEGV